MNEHASARVRAAAGLFVVLALAVAAWLGAHATAVARGGGVQTNANQQSPPGSPAGGPGPQAGQPQPPENPLIVELRKSIVGKEDKPAEQVFKNIQVLKGVTAGRLLNIMERGYTRALGVRCDYCHVIGEWEKDDKETKQTARDMVRMNADINAELKKIKTIAADNPAVNCSTCHRGQPKPGAGPRPQGAQPTPSPAAKP